MTNGNLQMVPAGLDRAAGLPRLNAADLPNSADGQSLSVHAGMEAHPAWPMIGRLPVMLNVSIPVRGFRLRDLLGLANGKSVASGWAVTEDVPLKTGALNICWGEFEVVEQKIAIRLTRLA